jgi:hypothetical protein
MSEKITNSKLIPHVALPFKVVMADVRKVRPPENPKKAKKSNQ